MEASQVYILIAVLGFLLILAGLFFMWKNKRRQKITPLTGLAFVFIIVGIMFETRAIAYSLMGIGVLLAVIDMIIKLKKK